MRAPDYLGLGEFLNAPVTIVNGAYVGSHVLLVGWSVKPRTRYGDFSIFHDGDRPPSWICYVCVGTTHEGF